LIYLDNAATTCVTKEVHDVIAKNLNIYGNPSSSYAIGKESNKILNDSRRTIESCLNLPQNSFIFTSGGSEADNIAIKAGFIHGLMRGRKKIVISSVEHHAISHAAEQMKFFDAIVEYVKVTPDGEIDINDLQNKVDTNTAIVSIMTSNNETGTIMNIYAASEIAHKFGALFHTDAVQGITHMSIAAAMVDMYSISGHKFHVPKGIGGLYIEPHLQEDLKQMSLISGGKQEFGLRAGTENIAYAIGLSVGIQSLVKNMSKKVQHLEMMHSYALEQLMKNFPYIKINGTTNVKRKNPSIINASFGFADAASIVEWANLFDICIASGSACNTGSNKPSHVLTAMGCGEKEAFSSIRISMSEDTSTGDIDELIKVLKSFESRYKLS
jgi:cysteine desulfurase